MGDRREEGQGDPLWYKDAIVYQTHVKAFFDSNDDGIGDFCGLTAKLDYIQDLGVTALWLLPFYPSPMRDDGYDIADYRGIHPDYGTLADFKVFMREATKRGLRVITELVINHTSDQHPWFQAARRAPAGSSKRNFYVWSPTKLKFEGTRIIFTDTETSNWAWDDLAGAYYWHRFFSHQPDLNFDNPAVFKAVVSVMRFWLDLGVDGLRLDAIPYLVERDGTNNENLPETHAVIKRMRAVVDEFYSDRLFLAEANQWPEDVRDYFGEGDECHMAYHFPLMPRIYMAVALEDRHPILEILRQTPSIPDNCQWAIFLRNHDELTLEMVTDKERDYMYRTYAMDRRMRVNVGIRRRLAPLMDNDFDRLKLLNMLLLSMPGSPVIYYGDEIGMGDNIYLGDRNGVRTPMQWSPDRNAGFSRADPQRLYLPPIMDPVYGYQGVNVEAQTREPSSLLNWMKRVIAVRKAHRAFGRGTLEFLHPGNRKIFAFLREHNGESILCVANLSRTAQPVELDLARFKGRIPVEMMGRVPFPPVGDLPYLLTLSPHGVYWFLLAQKAEVPVWHEETLPPADLPVLVLTDGWRSFEPERVEAARRRNAEESRRSLEAHIAQFLPTQRWFAAKGQRIEYVRLGEHGEWGQNDPPWFLCDVEVKGEGPRSHHYQLPLAILWEDRYEDPWPLLRSTVAKVRQKARVGLLCDAFTDDAFPLALLRAVARGEEIPFAHGRLRASATSAGVPLLAELQGQVTVRRLAAESSNTTLVLGERLFLKAYRRLHRGVNPELEVGRFLTERSPFPNAIPVLGALEYLPEEGEPVTLALLQRFVENQGDAWHYTLDHLERFMARYRVTPSAQPSIESAEEHGIDLMLMQTLGRRTGELHTALAQSGGDPAFDPEPVSDEEVADWIARVRREAERTLELLSAFDPPPLSRAPREALLAAAPRLMERLDRLDLAGMGLTKGRYHGDLHLGQVLVAQNDVVIIDFEGEPERPLAERRRKGSPLRDVAGMLRSFSYAAYAALFRLTVERPGDFALLEPFALQWQQGATRSFMEGYIAAAAGHPFYPADPAKAVALIELFTLEKALYEVRYELRNRPDWLPIPLKGVLGLIG